nr:MAG TPA: addiction module antidote protein [Caudoviricetes sp.]
MATEYNPNYCLHPGEFLKDDLETLGMSQKEFAEKSGYGTTVINEVIKGKRRINAEMALKFEEIIGEPASFWMDAQRNYDLFVAKYRKWI